jgi:hypothetical protein
VSHIIRFQRPETPYGVSRVHVPPEANAAQQLRRLEALGYTILEVSPPLPQAAATGKPSNSDLLNYRAARRG